MTAFLLQSAALRLRFLGILSCCLLASAVAVPITYAASPSIDTQPPAHAVIELGGSATLTAGVSGATSLQWKRNGKAIAGATAASLVLSDAAPYTHSGWYELVATNRDGSTVSRAAFVNVRFPARLAAWGNNASGQSSPTTAIGDLLAIAAGGNHGLALKSDGTVLAWGLNVSGQTSVPAGLSGVVAIAAGESHSLALKSDGTVVAWGSNGEGRATVPAGLASVVAIAAGESHSAALRADGTVVAWGNNALGQTSVPDGLSSVVSIAAGDYHTLALKADGTVVAWGQDSFGKLSIPSGLSGVVAVAAGGHHSLALRANGSVVGWGANGGGQATPPVSLGAAIGISAGDSHSLALLADGSVVAWGGNDKGQTTTPTGNAGYQLIAAGGEFSLGALVNTPPTISAQPAPRTAVSEGATLTLNATVGRAASYQWRRNGVPITGATSATLILPNASARSDAGWYQLRATNSNGTTTSAVAFVNVVSNLRLIGWGSNATGQTSVPSGARQLAAIDAGRYHSLALANDGTLLAWGYNDDGGRTTIPVGLSSVVAVSAGGNHSVALKSDGTVVAWGFSGYGALAVPADLNNVVAVSAGESHSNALKADGTVVEWGLDHDGRTTVVPTLSSVVGVAAGYNHSLALKADGSVVAWGGRTSPSMAVDYGQTQVPAGLTSVVAVAAGWGHSLALKSDGTVVAWGRNDVGQATVPAGLTGVIAIDADGAQSLALRSDGTIVAWGASATNTASFASRNAPWVSARAGSDHVIAAIDGRAPFISVSPTSQSVAPGDGPAFTVTAEGQGPLSYQWRRNGTPIQGATSLPLVLAWASQADAGQYDVIVSNAYGSATSVPATLTVAAPAPLVSPQLTNLQRTSPASIAAGTALSFSFPVTLGSGDTLSWVSIFVQDSAGNERQLISNGSGTSYSEATTTAWLNGAYTVTKVTVSGTASGRTDFHRDGRVVHFNNAITTPTTHSVSFAAADFTLTGGTSSLVSPQLTNLQRTSAATISAGAALSFSFPITLGAGDALSWVSIFVQDSAGNERQLISDGSGTTYSQTTTTAWLSGSYTVTKVTVSATASGRTDFLRDGTVVHFNNAITTPTSHSLSFAAADFSLTGGVSTLVSPQLTNLQRTSPATLAAGSALSFSYPITLAAGDTLSWVSVFVRDSAGNERQLTSSGSATSVSEVAPATWLNGAYTVTQVTISASASGRTDFHRDGRVVHFNNAITTPTTHSLSFASADFSLTGGVSSAPVITQQPESRIVVEGNAISLSVSATGTPTLTYQWRKDGQPIPGATNSTFSLTRASSSDAGSYSVVVANGGGSVTSAVVTLTVNPAPVAPTISSQPFSQTVTQGQAASFTVTAQGTAPLSYQWRKDGVAIPNATAASLTIGAVAASDAGVYTVIISNAAGSATSSAANLTVVVPVVAPTITTQPVSQSIPQGQSVTFSVIAQGTAPLTYQWRKDGSPIAGATGASYSIAAVASTDAASYTVVVSNGAGSLTSSSATLTVGPAAVLPTITTQPVSQTVKPYRSSTLSVAATGTAPLTYQWRRNGTPIAGATGPTFSIPVMLPEHAGDYTVVISNPAGAITTAVATLTLSPLDPLDWIGFRKQPMSQEVKEGQRVEISVEIGGPGGTLPGPVWGASVQWRKNGVNLPGATSGLLVIASVSPSDAGVYSAVASAIAGGIVLGSPSTPISITSNSATLTVIPAGAPSITQQPTPQRVAAGTSAVFSVTATGTGPLSYQWRRNGVDLTGATTATLTIPSVQNANLGNYTVVVTNSVGSVTSSVAALELAAGAPIVTASHSVPGNEYRAGSTVTVTNTLSFSASVSGLGWQLVIPEGWSYVSGGGTEGDIKPLAGTTDLLEWAWTSTPASPVTFTTTLSVPASATGTKALSALVLSRTNGLVNSELVNPSPLNLVSAPAFHSADTNRDQRISLLELTRVIELYNARNGTSRTGQYTEQSGTEDGFTPGTAGTLLTRYHSADSNNDGRISLLELTRVIELYNYRQGTVRTGQYRAQSGTEDGFAPGP